MTVIGLETEYGITGRLPDGTEPDPALLSAAVVLADTDVDLAGLLHSEPTADDRRFASRMLGNGGRLYVDHAHPEYCGPEVRSARDAVLWDVAGDWMVQAATQAIRERLGVDLRLFKNNTDGKGQSYGCHENYLLPRSLPFEQIVEHFAGFLATRIVITGAGRVGVGQRAERPGFQIAQRADFFERLVSLETTTNRGLVNSRDEPHANPRHHRRLHVIAGDANPGQYATWLKVGSTQLSLAAVEQGAASQVARPADPVAALQQISHDPELRRQVFCTDGRMRTAVQIQREWLGVCASLGPDAAVIDDAADVLQAWAELLDDLEQDRDRCADRVDWIAKYRLLRTQRRRHGLAWDSPRLAALDLQYSELDPGRSVQHALQLGGAVRTIVGVDDVRQAMTTPPADTRAWLRGQLIQRCEHELWAANWDSLSFGRPDGRMAVLRMPEPLADTRETSSAALSAVTCREVLQRLAQTPPRLPLADG